MVFPESYDDLVLASDDDAIWNVTTLSGVPRELFRHCRKLVHLASEKEQSLKTKSTAFRLQRIIDIEHSIKAYTQGEFDAHGPHVRHDTIQHWYDYYHASNAWKYALLLYIFRVFKWDRTTTGQPAEAIALARLTLDSVKCCRTESNLQKQLLFPVFLAGAESTESSARGFIEQYCLHWYQKVRYRMFKDALVVLQQIWEKSDRDGEDTSAWWGSFVSSHDANPVDEFLFG
jgi:hypothetical protein